MREIIPPPMLDRDTLVPPLPRAHSLLLQMSSLASRLFDVSPNRGALPPFLLPSSSPPSTTETLSLFHSLQTQLFESVAELQEILDLQDSNNKFARELRAKDSALAAFAKKIKESVLVLDRLVDDYAECQSRDLFNPNLDLNEVLSHAHKISCTTFAPPEHGTGLPPAPQDNEMRASQLYHFADLDVGVPKKSAVAAAGDGKEGVAAEAAADVLMEPAQPREEVLPMPGILPPMLPIAVPPGWRKGMPVELPMELPSLPPGWKPGDPLPLPPLDAVLAANKEEPPRTVPLGVQKAPEAIEVKYVQLDINPDQDDDSSDYSSDVRSLEDDDD